MPESTLFAGVESAAQPIAGAEAVRQRIVAAARTHFFTHGFRSVTTDDIAESLGMSKRTIYQHFSSKDELLKAVINDKFRRIDSDLDKVLSAEQTEFSDVLTQMISCISAHTGELHPPFMRDMHRESPEFFKLAQTRRREIIQKHFGKVLRTGREAGKIRKDIPVPLMIEILLGTVDAIINPAKKEELGLTPKTAFSSIISIFLEGVVVRKKEVKS